MSNFASIQIGNDVYVSFSQGDTPVAFASADTASSKAQELSTGHHGRVFVASHLEDSYYCVWSADGITPAAFDAGSKVFAHHARQLLESLNSSGICNTCNGLGYYGNLGRAPLAVPDMFSMNSKPCHCAAGLAEQHRRRQAWKPMLAFAKTHLQGADEIVAQETPQVVEDGQQQMLRSGIEGALRSKKEYLQTRLQDLQTQMDALDNDLWSIKDIDFDKTLFTVSVSDPWDNASGPPVGHSRTGKVSERGLEVALRGYERGHGKIDMSIGVSVIAHLKSDVEVSVEIWKHFTTAGLLRERS